MASPENPETEIELTHLARIIPDEVKRIVPVRLLDVYVPPDIEGQARLRLRQKGEAYEITKKVPFSERDASVHAEYTIPLDAGEFHCLSSVSNRRIEKDRYGVLLADRHAEVDIFRGLLKGLVLIDFEFGSEQEKLEFMPPSCCLADVTQEEFIAGGNLAGKSYSDIAPELEQYGYQPLSLHW